MASTSLQRFFQHFFLTTPWYVSPVSVPCQRCAAFDPPYKPSTNCKYYYKYDFTCASKFGEDPDSIPEFSEHNEASSIQLFYDLFFVANLSICTSNHPVTNGSTLLTYIGFFTLMWFTWFCTIIFDVRFAIDSWFTRLSKACSFGIMAAFAMTTIFFDTEDEEHFPHDAHMMSLVLMASRMFLVAQYLVTMVAVYSRHRDPSIIKPFALTICTSLAAAFVFLGLSFSDFTEHKHGYIGWYVTSVAEAAVLLIISYSNGLMKFDNSNIVERMGALTLIIMGEGIIGLTEQVSLILKKSAKISASTLGMVVAAVLIIYVLWMLYFDHTDVLDHPGARINKQKPWCQCWAFLHFPLHIFILVTLEGSARFFSLWNANEALNFLNYNFDMSWNYWPYVQNGNQLWEGVKLQLHNLTQTYPLLDDTISASDFRINLTALQNLGTFSSQADNDKILDILGWMNDALYGRMCDLFDIDVLASVQSTDEKDNIVNKAYLDWSIAFFVAAGCVLIFLAFARLVGHNETASKGVARSQVVPSKDKRMVTWVAVAAQCLIGIGLTLVSLLALPRYSQNGPDSDRYSNFIQSPWVIPTALLSFCIVIICDNSLYYWSSSALSSDILHPPNGDFSLAEGKEEVCRKTKKYEAEVKRLRAMLIGVGSDPMSGSLLDDDSPSVAFERFNGSDRDNESPLLRSSLSPHEYELDRMSARTKNSRASEMPLLKSSLPPNEPEFDARSTRTAYSRLTGDPDEGYGA